MCGICGVFDNTAIDQERSLRVWNMAESMVHRGPDDSGFYSSRHLTMGHRRLKIIDLSPLGRQPMSNEDGTIWISFNGEIYNYRELRSQLDRSHQFRSESDTEVIIHLYEERGDEFLQQLNGMFALALWDSTRQRLLLCRDRFGEKPLYYFTNGEMLAFASELKSLLTISSVPRELDTEALSTYLALGYVPAPSTIFKHIKKLPPASLLAAEVRPSEQGLRITPPTRYWQVHYEPDHRITGRECLESISELVRDAVRIRMYSDVPIGAFLSGGLDSSTVVAMMSSLTNRPVETFSIGFDEDPWNELPFAELAAKHFATRHHTFCCTPDVLELLPTLAKHYDEPFADASAIPTYCVSKMAREFVTVALSGDGGDEIFAGYDRYNRAIRREELSRFVPDTVLRQTFSLASRIYPRRRRGWGVLHRNSLEVLDYHLMDYCIYPADEQKDLLSRSCGLPITSSGPWRNLRILAESCGTSDLLSKMQYMDQMMYLPDDLLVKVDRASMAVSLETRAPFLDHRLAEFMAKVPVTLRFRGNEAKHLLKRVMAGLLPDQIIHRQKAGFGVPLRRWFRGKASEFAHDILLSQRAKERGLFSSKQIANLLETHARGPRDVSHKLWVLLFFEMWCRCWLDESVAAPEPTPMVM
ncbi:MAG: asparagine synthase (glutamine-hydrolyzing) [Acidobacteria bacterium]|nr:MAG: asparagine synthase (glutamine-hydrolyzing) [Acidobacteriota bacterium]